MTNRRSVSAVRASKPIVSMAFMWRVVVVIVAFSYGWRIALGMSTSGIVSARSWTWPRRWSATRGDLDVV